MYRNICSFNQRFEQLDTYVKYINTHDQLYLSCEYVPWSQIYASHFSSLKKLTITALHNSLYL